MYAQGGAAMDRAITDEILEELSSALQRVEAQSSAILELVRDKGIVKEDELAPYLERANAASSVRWRAVRIRLEGLLSGLEKSEQQAKEQRQEEARKSEAQKASEPKSTAQSESEKESPPRSSKAAISDEKAQGPQPKQPANADSFSDSGTREPRHPAQQSEKNTPPSAEQPPDKAKRPNAA
jgi:hypothetical protein